MGGGHLVCDHIKWCCQHGPGGSRGLFVQIISSRFIRVRGRTNWRQGRSFGQAPWVMPVLHRFVGRWQGAGGRRRIPRFARIRRKAGGDIFRHSSLIAYSGKFRRVLREDIEWSAWDDHEDPLFPYRISRRSSRPGSHSWTWWVPRKMNVVYVDTKTVSWSRGGAGSRKRSLSVRGDQERCAYPVPAAKSL